MAIQDRPSPRRNGLVLTLLLREIGLALRMMRRSDVLWVLGGGGILLSYGVGIVVVDIRAAADRFRDAGALWWLGLPAVCLALGAASGWAMGGIAIARSHAPFLAALPLSSAARRRMAAVATIPFGTALGAVVAALAGGIAVLVGRPAPLLVAAPALAACGLGYAATASARILIRPLGAPSGRAFGSAARGVALDPIDRAGLAWFGAWAWNLPGARLRATGRVLGWSALIITVSVLSAGASLARRSADPAVTDGIVTGLASFMLALRCRPLSSPVLRAAPLGFARAWLRLLRLPALLSAAVFLLPAGAAWAAEPAAWTAPLSGALWLGGLNVVYAVFGAYFVASPLLAAFCFVVTLGYAAYESIEYGSVVYLAVMALLALLWARARRRFRHG